MAYAVCEDCGTKLSGAICPNCQEELFIYETQSEYMSSRGISDEFMRQVDEQRGQVSRRLSNQKERK